MPRDLPDPTRAAYYPLDGFDLWVDHDCLDTDARERLAEELQESRQWLISWLGPALAPGDFRAPGEPRPNCPSDWQFGPVPQVGTIEVVVVHSGARCHADRDGIVMIEEHLAWNDTTHELVHYLAGSSWNPIDEGLAVYLTERIAGPDKGVPLQIRARAYRALNRRTDLTPRELSRPMSRRDYDVAGAFVGWLVESFGKERFFQLYAGAKRNYHGVFGVGQEELTSRFWEHVASLDVRQDEGYYRFLELIKSRR